MSDQINNQIKEKQRAKLAVGEMTVVLSFFLPIFIMLIGFVICGIYPFGDRCFLSTDMYHQYMPFFREFMRSIKAGEGVSFTWNVGIGSNFLALYVYYLASPFHWLGLVVPERFYIEFLSYLIVFKIGLCGLTSYLFFRYRGRRIVQETGAEFNNNRMVHPELAALFFSMFYALSGFLAAYNWNIMWIDCVVLLPLIVMGLELLVREGKPGLYCVTLALSIYTNYYISIMICIFLVLYFIFLYCTEQHPVKAGRTGRKAKVLAHIRPAGQFALYSLLAGGMAAVLLIPEVCAILETDFGDSEFPKKVESYFSVLDMLARHCVAVSVEKGLDHWPNIYCGAPVFLFVPFYAMNEKIPARRRFGMMALAGVMLLGFSTNVLNFIWHGLNYPDSLPGRQSFIYVLVVLIMCYEACCHMDRSRPEHKEYVVKVFLGVAVFMLFVEKFAEHEDIVAGVEWLTLLFISIYASAIYMAHIHTSRKWRNGLAFVVLVAILAETGINTCCTSIANVSRSEYLKYQEDYKNLYAWTQKQEEGFYRVEKFSKKTKNDGTLAGYPTASVFSSTMNSAVKDMYERLGMRYSKVFYDHDGATAFVSALLNVKYMFAESEDYASSVYQICNSSEGVTLYKNVYTLPFGYVAPYEYDLPEGFGDSGLRLQNQMLHDLGIEKQLFTRCESDASGDGVMFTASEDGVYYGIVTADGTSEVKRMGSGVDEMRYKNLKDGSILYLGGLQAGDFISLTNDNEDDTTPNICVDIYRMDEQVLQEAINILAANHMKNVTYDANNLSGNITLQEAGRVILSVPYEKGWTVTINGEEVEPALFGESLMAFDLQAGEYEFKMHYVPYGKGAGIAVSVVSVLAFAGIMLLRNRGKQTAR